MMNFSKNIQEISLSLIHNFYNRDMHSLASDSSNGTIWFVPGSTSYINNFSELNFYFSSLPGFLVSRIYSEKVNSYVPYNDMCIVTCSYLCSNQYMDELYNADSCSAVPHTATLIWCCKTTKPTLLYVLLSECSHYVIPQPVKLYLKNTIMYLLMPDEIIYICVKNSSCHIVCKDRTIIFSTSLNALLEQLPPQFIKIHRSYVVNCQYISSIYRYCVELTNGRKLPIPEKRYMDILFKIEQLSPNVQIS